MASPPIISGMNEAGSPPFDVATAWTEFGARLRAWLERRVAQPADAEDLLQQVFLRMAAKPPAVATNESLGAWLWRVARNALVDHYRRRERRRMDALDAEVPDELGDGAGASLVRCLRPMLRGLPPLYGDAVLQADLEGRRQADLAAEAGVSVSAMKSRVQRGRQMLHDLLRACCGVPGDGRLDGNMDCGGCGVV
ncbi:MAG: sigma-70 family RNA polymerase sigma factor [Dehalococcoidia bacterium]